MPEDIKQALYAVLGRKKLGKPDYIFQQQPGGGRGQQRFKCHLTVAGIAYTGLGNSTSKKDAQSNAAMDFGHFLVREGLVTADELPQLQLLPSQQSDTAASSSTTSAAPAPAALNPNFIPVGQPPPMYGQPPPMNPAAMEWDFTGDSVDDPNLAGFSGAGGFGAARIHRQQQQQQLEKSWHDQYVEQKAEQVSQSEAVDMTAEIHGGWTMENCKQALNEFCQKNRQPIGEYKMGKTGTDNDSTFVAEQQIFLAQQNRTIYGRGQGSSQKVAKTSCALNIVRQLFHIGLLPAVAGAKQARKKNKADDLPQIKVEVDQGLVERIQQFLADAGVQPVDLENFDAEPAEEEEERVMSGGQWKPRSLLIDQKLENFPESEHKPQPGATVAWAPPLQNWNAWRAANIDTQPIAFWPMDRISEDLRMREKAKELPARMRQTKEALPVFKHRDQIIRTVTENPVVLIKGSTGCGKSTQICQYLLESHLLDRRGADFNCYVTQPRRISAITLAERVAMERCEQLGDSIGYSVRFEGVTPRPYGAVMFVTVGVLMRRMEAGLRGISHVIIDEIHERDINTDFLLIAIRDMVQKNQKLRVLLMSATIDTNLFTNYFGHCPIIEIEQRVHPVQHFFLEDTIAMLHYMPQQQTAEAPDKKKRRKAKMRPGGQQPAGGAQSASGGADDEEEGGENSMSLDENLMVCADNCPPEVKKALGRMSEKEISFELIEALLKDIDAEGFPGSILIFLPGWQLISLMWNRLSMHPVFSNQRRFVILPLHSQLSAREQHRVFEPVGADRRKIILSTNLAETSVTIDDVVYVIDSCRVREKMYTSRNNLVHFANVWASRTNLLQRRGRAGRVRAGFCFHLITKARFQALEEHRTAEMLRTPLHEITLTIKLLHLGSAGDFLEKAVQPPPIDAVVEAEVLLREMNALDRNLELTELGRILARLPIEPKLGKMVLLGAALGIGDLMLTAAAATSFNSPFVSRERFHTKLAHIHRSFSGSRPSDHIGLVNVNQQFQAEQEIDPTLAENFCYGKSLSYPLLNMTQEAKRQLNNILIAQSGLPASVFAAYPIDVHGPDPNLDVFLSLLIHAYYPNICYMRDRRRVFTLEQAVALLGNMSVCVPFAQGEQLNFASPLFMFTEKLRTSCISCKQVSMISPLQLLLFGCRKVEALGPSLVRLDNMIPLEMSASVAAKIVALRPCLEALVVRTCLHPEQLSKPPEEDQELVKIVRELSSDRSWLPTGERGRAPIVPGTSGNARTSAKKEPQQQAAYPYSAADQHAYATPQLPRMPWQMPPGPGPFPLPRPGKRPWRTSTGEEPASQPAMAAAAATGYSDQPMPMVPVLAGQEAIAAANGLAATAATEPLQDFSTMAGYGPSNYYGSGLPGSMEPQRRQPLPPLEPNGFFEPNGHQQPQQHHTHMFRGTFPRHNNGPRGRGRRGGRAMGRGGGGNIGERGGRGGGGGGAATRAVARGRGFPRGRQRHHPPPA